MKLRPYQEECLVHAKVKNTIVCLPTGFGKTLIAARLIEHYLQRHPQQKVAFLVPTRPLVEQQSKYCIDYCKIKGSPPVIQRLVGDEQASWKQSDWDASLRHSHMFFGTAALFQQAFVTDKYMHVGQFSLIVLDECHNAVGNSPMAAVMRDGVAPYAANNSVSPRILGLTASFVNGNLCNMERKRQALESLLLSNIICPSVKPKLELDSFTHIPWTKTENLDERKELIEGHVRKAVTRVGWVKELQKVVSRCIHVFIELGTSSLFFYIEKVIVQQILAKIRLLEQDPDCMVYAQRLQAGLPGLRQQLRTLSNELSSDLTVKSASEKSNKLKRLLELLDSIFHKTMNYGSCGIVFVEQVALVSCLAKHINDNFRSTGVKCGAVAGTSYQNEADRQDRLDAFKSGKCQILVATATLEEGIDVSECLFVIRYNNIATTKAHIQGAGRARHPNAQIYYFSNDPFIERQKEAAMSATARNSSLALAQSDLRLAAQSMNASVKCRHPYPFSSRNDPNSRNKGEVNVFNCKQIFNQYCSMTLGQSVSPKTDLFKHKWTGTGSRKILIEVRYPTPYGWQIKTETDCKTFWGGVDMEKVFHRERVKKKTASEKEEMCFVYIVIVELRDKGWLTVHNKPDPAIHFETRRNCPLLRDESSDYLTLRNGIFQS